MLLIVNRSGRQTSAEHFQLYRRFFGGGCHGRGDWTDEYRLPRSLERTKEQFSVNNLDDENHKICVMDVFDFIRYAIRKELQYDVPSSIRRALPAPTNAPSR